MFWENERERKNLDRMLWVWSLIIVCCTVLRSQDRRNQWGWGKFSPSNFDRFRSQTCPFQMRKDQLLLLAPQIFTPSVGPDKLTRRHALRNMISSTLYSTSIMIKELWSFNVSCYGQRTWILFLWSYFDFLINRIVLMKNQ